MATKSPSRLVKAGCPDCAGSGFTGEDKSAFCPTCKGAGYVLLDPAQTAECDKCKGKGHVENVPCFPCAHTGKIVVAAPDPKAPKPVTIEELQENIAQLKSKVGEQAEYIAELEKENKGLASDYKKLAKQLEKAKAAKEERPAESAVPETTGGNSGPGDDATSPKTT